MNKNNTKLTLVKSKFTSKCWLENSKGKRITPKFLVLTENHIDEFVKLRTSIGIIIYNRYNEQVLYKDIDGFLHGNVSKLTDTLYCIDYYLDEVGNSCQLYSPQGEEIVINGIFTQAWNIGNGFIAMHDFFDGWGILDENLNWLVEPRYEEVAGLDNYGLIVALNQSTTDIIKIEKAKEAKIVTVSGSYVMTLSSDYVLVSLNKKFGVVDITGKEIIPIIYDSIQKVGNGEIKYFIVKREKNYGLFDKDGNVIRECEYCRMTVNENKLLATKFLVTSEEIQI